MLARLDVFAPFEFTLQENEYKIYSFGHSDYQITFELPSRSAKPQSYENLESIQINKKPAFQANVITITFKKDIFDRTASSSIDPPAELIQMTLDSLLQRVKYVAKAPQVKFIEFPRCQWHLKYLNDDGSELEQEEGYLRGRGSHNFSFSFLCCDPALWDSVFTLPEDFELPAWHALLVDSRGALPHVGTALVLAATALEIFIAELLDKLVVGTAIPNSLWSWINDRGNWQKEPSVEEQFDVMLKTLTGHSLKEDTALWDGLKHLKKARNSFVHEGVAKLGGETLTPHDTLVLIGKADEIVAKIREWVPENCQWPVFERAFELEIIQKLFEAQTSPDEKNETGTH